MPELSHLLHAPGLRRRWRWLLVAMLAATSWLAFAPSGPQPDALPYLDKLQHTLAFAALTIVAMLASGGRLPRLRVGLALLAYGLFIELVQARLPSRQGDVLDLLADGLGIVLGVLAVGTSRRRWPRPIADT